MSDGYDDYPYWREAGLKHNPHPTLGEQIAEGERAMDDLRALEPTLAYERKLEATNSRLRALLARGVDLMPVGDSAALEANLLRLNWIDKVREELVNP